MRGATEVAYQQPYPPHAFPPYANGNGHDLSKGKLPVLLALALVAACVAGTWTAGRVYADYEKKEKTTNDRLDGLDKRLGGIEGSLGEIKELVARHTVGPWTTETRRH